MFNEAFSHGKKFKFNSDDLPFTTLDEYVKTSMDSFVVREVFINPKAKFGARPAVVSDKFKMNLPKHFVKDIEKILATPEMIEAINNGKCGFVPETYEKDGKTYNSGKFFDIT